MTIIGKYSISSIEFVERSIFFPYAKYLNAAVKNNLYDYQHTKQNK